MVGRVSPKQTHFFIFEAMHFATKIKYAYGYKFNAIKMKRQKIVLSFYRNGKPDYQYMKEYMQIQEIMEQHKITKFYNIKRI